MFMIPWYAYQEGVWGTFVKVNSWERSHMVIWVLANSTLGCRAPFFSSLNFTTVTRRRLVHLPSYRDPYEEIEHISNLRHLVDVMSARRSAPYRGILVAS